MRRNLVARDPDPAFPENAVQGLVLVHLLIWATLVVLLWFGATWLQGLLYSEPAAQLFWRAPAAAAVLTLWLAFWCTREYRAYVDDNTPSRYGALFQFNAEESRAFNEFWVKDGDQKVRYMKRTLPQGKRPGHPEFIAEAEPHRPWSGSETVILKEDNQEVVYTLLRDKNNKIQRTRHATYPGGPPSEGPALYRSDRGKAITEDMIRYGKIATFRWGMFFMYGLLNVGFLVLAFACLWVLLRFQWTHALGIASVFWLITVIFLVPPLVERVDHFAEGKPRATAMI